MSFPPNISPKSFTLSAIILGYILIDDFTANEQNSIANWLMLVGQVLETNAAQQQLIHSRQQEGTTKTNNHFTNFNIEASNDELQLIKSAMNKMQLEIDKLIKEQ